MIDLHTHSNFSDGTSTPEELVAEARNAGLTAIALTDHDTVGGLDPFLAAGAAAGLETIPGVEISSADEADAVHLLGYYIDHQNRDLQEQLKWIREERDQRNRSILLHLADLGLRISMDEVRKFAGVDVVGRLHIALALQARGFVSSTKEAFRRYLGSGRPAYVPRQSLTPEQAIQLIKGAGGVPVLAHPFVLRLGIGALRELLRTWQIAGLQGVEAWYPEHTERETRHILKLAAELDLVPTGGSDFHGANTPDIRLGRGFGSLQVPDESLASLRSRRPPAIG